MSNSCHMQYGHALRWAWGCLMGRSLILGQREQGGMRDKNKKRKTKRREIQIINKTAVVDFGQLYQSIQSHHHIFQVQPPLSFGAFVMGSEQETFIALLDS